MNQHLHDWHFQCEACGKTTPASRAEIDAKERVICPDCYLADPPAEDVDSALAAIEAAMEDAQ